LRAGAALPRPDDAVVADVDLLTGAALRKVYCLAPAALRKVYCLAPAARTSAPADGTGVRSDNSAAAGVKLGPGRRLRMEAWRRSRPATLKASAARTSAPAAAATAKAPRFVIQHCEAQQTQSHYRDAV
jgi:hypothetical protein